MFCKKTIWYLVVDQKHQPTQEMDKVSVRNRNDVADLRDMVKEKSSIEAPAVRLVIWRCKDPKTLSDINELKSQVSDMFSDKLKEVEELDPRDKIGDLKLFKAEVLLVEILPPKPLKSSNPGPLQGSIPSTPPNDLHLYTSRHQTVAGIYNKLQEDKYIQIRGPPGSGKTTLAKLIHQYILEQEKGTKPLVAFITGWKDRDSMERSGGWRKWLAKARIWNAEKNSVLIVDEAQESYWDASFWEHIKQTKDNSPHRIITLVSYGRTGTDPSLIIPLSPMQKQVVGLNAIDYGDGIKVGLLLTTTEFRNFVCKRCPGHWFSEEFLASIYDLTDGHVGACDALLTTAQAHDSYRSVKSVGRRYTSADFNENINTATLFTSLGEHSIFSRGLPTIQQMKNPGITEIFYEVLRNGKKTAIAPHPYDGESTDLDLQKCIRNGWLYDEHPPPDSSSHDYVFASQLHAHYVQWCMLIYQHGKDLHRGDIIAIFLKSKGIDESAASTS